MFTVKLVQGNRPNNTSTQVFSCNHYSIWEGPDWTEIILYKDYNTQDGVGYKITSNDIGVPHFDKCYIENINGKTINTVAHVNEVKEYNVKLNFTEAIEGVKEGIKDINKAFKGNRYISTRVSSVMFKKNDWAHLYEDVKKDGLYIKVENLMKYKNFKGFKDSEGNLIEKKPSELVKCVFDSNICSVNDILRFKDVPEELVLEGQFFEGTNNPVTIPTNMTGKYYISQSGHVICESIPTDY